MKLSDSRAASIDSVLDSYSSDTDLATALTSLLTDAMHWSIVNGESFDAQLRFAHVDFACEGGGSGSAIAALGELYAPNRMISNFWCINDVRHDRPYLTERQAWEVLRTFEERLHTEYGINWSLIRAIADELYPRSPGKTDSR